jgi:hypothetical protein
MKVKGPSLIPDYENYKPRARAVYVSVLHMKNPEMCAHERCLRTCLTNSQ